MQRFHWFKGEATNNKSKESFEKYGVHIGNEKDQFYPINIMIDLNEVEAIRDYVEGETPKRNGSIIYLKSKENFWVKEDVDKIAEILNKKC